MRAFIDLLRRRPYFRRLWLGEVVSLLGDWMSLVAVSLLAMHKGGSVLSLGIVLVAHILPVALLAPIAGTLADRLDRRRQLVGAAVIQSALTLAIAAAAAAGNVVLVQVLIFVRASIGAFFAPAQSAAIRRVVEPDELLVANTLMSSTWSVMFAVGMAVGGAIAALGPTLALLIDASSFAVAALLLLGLPSMVAEGAPRDEGIFAAVTSVHRDIADAWKYAWRRPDLLHAVLAKAPVAFGGGGAWVLLNLVTDDKSLALSGALALGLLQCVRGIGTGVGPFLSLRLLAAGLGLKPSGRLAAVTAFAGMALLSAVHGLPLLVLAAFIWGMGSGSNWVLPTTQMQRLSPDKYIGRLSAIDGLTWTLTTCVGALLGAALVDRLGVPPVTAWFGLALGVVSWVALERVVAFLSRRSRVGVEIVGHSPTSSG